MTTEGTSRRTFALLAIWWGLFLVAYGIFLVRTPAHRQEIARAVTQLSAGHADGRILIIPLALVTFAFWAACRLVRFSPLAIVPLGMIGIILGVLGPQFEWTRQQHETLRCRIAIGHWDEALARRLAEETPLPDGADASALFADFIARGYLPEADAPTWNCPCRAGSTEPTTGYVFVGGALSPQTARKASALLLFCAAGSHPMQHAQHAVLAGEWLDIRECSPLEMVRLIEQALEQAKTGAVPYSADAVTLLRRELQARKPGDGGPTE
ncbi:hypothetical protein HQ560_07170 [bacterium]|nr:hypothetical protein [bacterium]